MASGFNEDGVLVGESRRIDPVRIGTATWASIDTGAFNTAGLRADGALWTWGDNTSGQIGDGTRTLRPTPVQVASAIDWDQVTVGTLHMAALKVDGSLWAWGDNRLGQVGDGTTTNRSVPTKIGTATNWAAVDAGYLHTVALKDDGSLWAWGYNDWGQLGDGTTTTRPVPTRIGTGTDWADIAVGDSHTVARKTDGSIWAWGNGTSGQVGNGFFVGAISPTRIGTATDWASVSAGDGRSFAIKEDGTLWAWGSNSYGALGDNTTTNRNVPTKIGTATTWGSVRTGGLETVALRTDGSLWKWGLTTGGVEVRVPTRFGTGTTWSAADAGGSRRWIAALKTDGSLWAWGYNFDGQLGDPATPLDPQVVPFKVGGDADWATVDTGGRSTDGTLSLEDYTVAVKTTGTLWAWGKNQYGQLGDGTTDDRTIPTQIGADTNWATVATGRSHTVAVKTNGTLWTWGNNEYGQLGDGTTDDRTIPTQIGADTNWATVAAGADHTMATRTNGTLWAWGDNGYFQLGDGTQVERDIPTQIGTDTNWATVAAGTNHSAAVKTTGTLYAWGWNDWGQVGTGASSYAQETPIQVGTDNDWATISAGWYHTTAVKTTGTLWSWGGNTDGQLGDGTTTGRKVPTKIGSATDWAVVDAGVKHTAAVKTTGTLWAWGLDTSGQLGIGNSKLNYTGLYDPIDERLAPVQVGTGTTWTSVAAGTQRTIGLRTGPPPVAPEAPTGILGTPGNAQVAVSWMAPASNGGAAITSYTATASPGGKTCTWTTGPLSCTVTGLTNGTPYTFTVRATNAVGPGDPSAPSGAVTPRTVPGAPTIGTATAGNAQATLTWTAPASNGGAAISGYVVTPYIAAAAQSTRTFNSTATTQIVTGLVNDTTYTFKVAARNVAGTGAQSAASNEVTPAVPPLPPYHPFASWSAFVTRQFTDLTAKAPTSSQLTTWVNSLSSSTKTKGDLIEALRRGTDNTTNIDPAARLYRAFLGRTPDAAGLRFWVTRRRTGTWTLVRIADYFAASNEFTTKYGALTNRQFVTRIYTDVLDRTADPAGVDFWTNQLDLKLRTRGSVMVGFSESSEYKRKQAENTDAAVAYIFLLGRTPTAAEVTDWVARQRAGTTQAALATELLDSDMYAAHVTG